MSAGTAAPLSTTGRPAQYPWGGARVGPQGPARGAVEVVQIELRAAEVGLVVGLVEQVGAHDGGVIAVAGGSGKLEAVRGALRGRFMNVLVTDQDVAAALLATKAAVAEGPD